MRQITSNPDQLDPAYRTRRVEALTAELATLVTLGYEREIGALLRGFPEAASLSKSLGEIMLLTTGQTPSTAELDELPSSEVEQIARSLLEVGRHDAVRHVHTSVRGLEMEDQLAWSRRLVMLGNARQTTASERLLELAPSYAEGGNPELDDFIEFAIFTLDLDRAAELEIGRAHV